MRYPTPILLLAVLLCAAGLVAQTIDGLQVPPVDTADAQRIRIWAAAEGTTNCRMNIIILDDSSRVVRHYLDFLASPGYYNFYWDKRDDFKARVPEGNYRAKIDYCGTIDFENLTVQYSKWELQSELGPYDPAHPFWVELILRDDSASVAIDLLYHNGNHAETVLPRTKLGPGAHHFPHEGGDRVRRGNYVLRIQVGDYEYRREVTYLP